MTVDPTSTEPTTSRHCNQPTPGHTEEIHALKLIRYKEAPYLVSASQDSTIRKWQVTLVPSAFPLPQYSKQMRESWDEAVKQTVLEDAETNIVVDIAFIPNTGNRYLFVFWSW